MLASLTAAVFTSTTPLLAQQSGSDSAAWAIVLGCIILGLLITLKPSHRTSEVHKPKEG